MPGAPATISDPLLDRLEATAFQFAEGDLRAAAALMVRIAATARSREGITIPYSELVKLVGWAVRCPPRWE